MILSKPAARRAPGLASLAALALPAVLATCAPPPERPNVLVVVVDTLRADWLSVYGYEQETTPFLEELARRSVVYESAWSTSSWTAPAAASLFTSVYPTQHGITTGMQVFERRRKLFDTSLTLNRLPDGIETLATMMKKRGYRTFGVSDNPNVASELGFDRGFDRFQSFDYGGAPVVNYALRNWREEILDSGEPWFVYLHYMDPHTPYHPREPWFDAPGSGAGASELRETGDAADWAVAYRSEIRYLDEHLREAFELLEVGPAEAVVVTADHGEEFLDHGGTGHGWQLYSELMRVPLLIQHPGATPARRTVRENVSIVDLLPTLREIVGAPPSNQDEGMSLVPSYLGTANPLPSERPLFAMRSHARGVKTAVVRGPWKAIWAGPGERPELYDLDADPGERVDLAADRGEVLEELRELWAAFDARARRWQPAVSEVQLDASQLERLSELGYAATSDVHR